MLLAHNLRSGGGLVVGTNFICQLKRVAPQHQYLVTVPQNVGYEDIELPYGSELCRIETGGRMRRLRFDSRGVKRLIRDYSPAVVFGMGNLGVIDSPVPQAIWIQNAYMAYPGQHYPHSSFISRSQIFAQRMFLKRCIPTTQWIFCQTSVMVRRICEYYRYPVHQTGILPNSISGFIDGSPSRDSVAEDIFSGRGKEDFYCLILSSYYTHKNPEIILRFLRNTEFSRTKHMKFITTITENDHPKARRFLQEIKKPDFRDHILNVGRISPADLSYYYTHSDLVIMPTLLESFSGTYLEAMHFGVPILTTDLDFAHCICGSAALYYNPWTEEDFADKVFFLFHNPEKRAELAEAGRAQIKVFSESWDQIARQAIGTLEQIAGKLFPGRK